MNYLQNIRSVLALDFKTLDRFDQSCGQLVYLNSSRNNFLGVQLSLLPDTLERNFIRDLKPGLSEGQDEKAFKYIIRLAQEDSVTRRLDFYSWKLEIATGNDLDKYWLDDVKDKICLELSEHWTVHPVSDHFVLFFSHAELELLIMIELLADIEYYPFWDKLHQDFHFHLPTDHIPDIQYYLHFVIRKRFTM